MKKSAYLDERGNVKLKELERDVAMRLHEFNPKFMFKEKNCDVKPIFLARGFTKENLIEIVNHFSSICAGEAYEVRPLIDVANKEGYLHKNLAMGVEIAIKTPGLANEYYLRKWG